MKLKVYACCLLVSVGQACHSILEEEPLSSVTINNFYQTEKEARGAVTAIYSSTFHSWETYWGHGQWLIDLSTDDVQSGPGRDFGEMDNYTFTPTHWYIREAWAKRYDAIAKANIAIERIPGIAMNEKIKNQLLGEARFLRAFNYLGLVNLFGEAPLVSQFTYSLSANLYPARAAADDLYAFIETDLQAAGTLLADAPLADREPGRVTLGAAKALLARMYLYRGNYPAAAQKAKEVIDLNVYRLNPVYGANFSESSENGPESILEVQFEMDAERATDFGRWLAPRNAVQDSVFTVNSNRGEATFTATEDVYAAYEPGDLRRTWNFSRTFTRENGTTGVLDRPYISKYRDFTAQFGAVSYNYPVLRYADVLLMYAESAGPTAAGYEALNQVRRRAFGAHLTTPSPYDVSGLGEGAFREAVRLERRRELFAEGLRRADLVRTGQLAERVKAENPSAQVQPFQVVFPVPQQELDRNANLQQTPGY